ncbi:Outer membrane protein P4 [Phocoenobacter uteri]|uniref:Outer membrane protein P4 n=1 Tax=Phocoenobacter uteri TaxID=146806 RepID=A0A379CCX1_9PAST|nr:5'-nucleotidase, lipoprotein e(P4) family [Phocoenobacter uteri]MDG6881545.1 hypothetical protein [Phocoenobacter uteri]SUB59575.1 Outer membrane protein P4 [Phocoenobacter uteri]
MKKTLLSIALLASSMAFAQEPINVQSEANKVATSQELGMAVYWYQTSGEAKALYQQAFNVAKLYFDSYKAQEGKKKAVVVDLDETMMDNSEYAVYQFSQAKPYTSETWKKWVEAERTRATMGAVAFNNYVNANGGTVFYVSNRRVAQMAPTIKNLQALGFEGVSEERMYLKDKSSKKQERYREIEKKGYEIVQYIGDNLNDFTDETYHGNLEVRDAWVTKHAAEFGTKYIVMPNPLYGGFDSATHYDIQQRHKALRLTDWYK